MITNSLTQIIFFIVVLQITAVPLGIYIAKVFKGQKTLLSFLISPIENGIYKICKIDPEEEMSWKTYAITMFIFNIIGLIIVYILQRLQVWLPLNPQSLPAVSADSAFNTAVSFATNTNWQGYSGETTMSYLTQVLGLNVQNFLSAATGIAVLFAFFRGFTRQETKVIGNFWSDLTKSILYIFLPLSIILSICLVSQGSVQSFAPYQIYHPLEKDITKQISPQSPTIALGPAASQIAIKQLGTNGGGFFNVNSAHPFENPTPFSNFLELISILLISTALCHTFGHVVNDKRQGIAILAAMTIIFIAALSICFVAEANGNPVMQKLGADIKANPLQCGGNMEGKEVRFGIVNSAIWAIATTCASNGSVDSMHDSFTPLGGLMPMLMMQLSEVIFGGVGCGLYGMLVYAIMAVFVAGLMVGRTPEYLGKKIESFEMKMASLIILIPPILVLLGTALAVSLDWGRSSILNPGAHGFSEILYAFSSAGNNNGSAFAGLNANTPFYNYSLGICMFFSRYWLAIPVLAIAGSIAQKKLVPVSLGTMPTHNLLFVILLISIVLIIGALTFIPALALGPIVEHLQLMSK